MTGRALFGRVATIQAALPLTASGLTLAVAPRALLLESADLGPAAVTLLRSAVVVALLQAFATYVLLRPARRVLLAMSAEGGEPLATDLAALDAMPATLVGILMALASVEAAATLHPAFWSEAHGIASVAPLALFHWAVVASAALPLYVVLRAMFAKIFERAPARVAAEALELEESAARGLTRVRTRFLLAALAPVAFIALAASLLAYAHVNAAAEEGERQTAIAVAHVALDSVAGSRSGSDQAISAAAGFGVRIATGDDPAGGAKRVRAAFDDREAFVEMQERPVVARSFTYAIVVAAAALFAGLLGLRVGALYSTDLAMARATIDATGGLVVGAKVPLAEPRFASVSRLLYAVGELGLRFREFAAAHEQATSAKESTERMRALFLAAMSHDLKSPLNSILGFATLVEQSPLTAEQRQSLQIIEQRGRELLYLIGIILDAARAEAGQLEITLDATKLDDVIMSAVLDARDLALGSEVTIQVEIQPGSPIVAVDAHRMVQALVGVIGTAARFTEKGTVAVRATFGPGVTIGVETAGRGLHPGEREKIFEAFKYPDRARRLGSLGLELSLARSIVERHRGVIDVDVPQGGGIVFQIRLPGASDEAPASVPRPSVRPSMLTRPE